MVGLNPEEFEREQWLHKGKFLRAAFDAAYSDPLRRDEKYQAAIDLLDSGEPLFSLTQNWDSPQRAQFEDQDRNDFGGDSYAEWLSADPQTEEYLKGAFREAIARAQERNVGLEAIWITTGDSERIDIGYVDHPTSVTLVIKSPQIPDGFPLELLLRKRREFLDELVYEVPFPYVPRQL